MRNIAASGLLPYMGVHHKSKTNAFNLADDLIESFRPIVDFHVYKYLDYLYLSNDETLSLEIRRELQKIFVYQIKINDNWIKFPASCRIISQSYVQALQSSESRLLKLPKEWREQ